VTRPRAADDFTTIRARMEELRRERDRSAARDRAAPVSQPRRDGLAGDLERRAKEKREGWPPPWVPTIFVKR